MISEVPRSNDSYDELHGSRRSSLTAQALARQNTSGQDSTQEQFDVIPAIRKRFHPCIKSFTVDISLFALYTVLATSAGILIVYFTYAKSGKTCQRDFKRTMNSSLISSSHPCSIAVSDLNNDQHIDVVVANSATNTIGIFYSRDDQTFSEQHTYVTGSESRPCSVAISDFNHDNCLDIAVANYGTNNIAIFLGNENGTFKNQTVFSLGNSHPIFITTADFNRDNRTDIVVVNYGTNSIGILLGYSNGSFRNQTTYFTGYDSIPYALAIGDLNSDHQLDIVVANYGTDNIGIFLGQGNGMFARQQIYTTLPKSNPTSIAIGDVNNDSHLDIVVSNKGVGTIGIFLGHGNGMFRAQTTYSTGFNSHPQHLTIGDLDNDYALDIVVVDSQNDRVYIFPGYGNGTFPTIATYDTTPGSEPFSVALADFNKDNRSDIAVVNYQSNDLLVLIDYSINPLVRQRNYAIMAKSSSVSVVATDLNNNHISDIVYFVPHGSIRIRFGLGHGLFDSENTYPIDCQFAPQYICVGDLNNDNRMDIVSANAITNNVGVSLGDVNGTFNHMTIYSTGINSSPWWVALGDMNNDNRLDIVSANTGANTIGILLGNGDGTFTSMVAFSTVQGTAPHSVAVGNLNNDVYLDLVVVDNNDVVIVFLGRGDGTFKFINAYSTNGNSNPISIALADLNADNYLDVVVANTLTNSIGVFLGYGDGTLRTQASFSTGPASNPYYVTVADFNYDNKSDIAVTNFGTHEVVLFHGYGNGSFTLKRRFPSGYGSKPYGMTTTEFGDSEQLGLVVTLFGSKYVAILTEYNAAEFVQVIEYSTGSAPQPLSVAVGDFDDDSRSDIVVANSGTNNLSILFPLHDGKFGRQIDYPMGSESSPSYVITCDFNSDNQLDIVSVNSEMNGIAVIMGYGNGTFAEQQIYSTEDGSYPIAVTSGDLNNDNRVDLVIVNEDTNSISILLGFNYTGFREPSIYSTADSLATSGIDLSDFNNDTYLDIVATFYWSNTIGILLGYGNGSFASLMTYSTGNRSGPWGISVGDFNNDHRSDIVVTNSNANNIGFFLGYGNGTFTTIVTYSTGARSHPEAVAVNDLNNDGRSDVVVANYGTNSVRVLLGNGNGTFSDAVLYSTGESSTSLSVTVGDFNNDGNLDIAVANYGTECIGILLGYGDGTFKSQTTISMDHSRRVWLAVNDFNNDHQLDIAIANWNTDRVGILFGYGNGTFAALRTYSTGSGSTPNYLNVGDFNNDKKLDIAVVNQDTNSIVILFGFGDGNFLLGVAHSTGVIARPYALAIGDFNNDTRLDIAVANNYADIVVANYGTDSVGIFLGHGNGSFQMMTTWSSGIASAPSFVAIADFNSDTHSDVVIINSQIDNILILLGYGDGTFAAGFSYSTGARSSPYAAAVGDFNNDNIPDLVVANYGTNNIVVFHGHGDGTFGNMNSYSLGYDYRPYAIAVKDLNQDNWLDIVIACRGTDHIEILMKMC